MITFTCRACSRSLRAAETLVGKNAQCPACSQKTLIPPAVAPAGSADTAPTLLPTPSPPADHQPAARKEASPDAETQRGGKRAAGGTPAKGAAAPVAPSALARSRDSRAPAGYEILEELG